MIARALRIGHHLRRHAVGYGVGAGITSLMTACIALINHLVSVPNISLLYLPAILLTAVYFGAGPSLLASTLAVVEYDFFLLRPVFTFTIAQAQDVLAFVIFLIVALLTSHLAARARARTEAAQRRAREHGTLYDLGHALMVEQDLPHVLQAITRQTAEALDLRCCAILVPDTAGRLELQAETNRGAQRTRDSYATASWVYQQGSPIELPFDLPVTTKGPQPQSYLYLPLRTADRTVGVIEIGPKRSGEPFDTEERQLVTSIAAQAALVLVRAAGDEERTRRHVLEESDRVKSALLSAVSHDLRTPLASIKTAVTTLLLPDTSLQLVDRRELLDAINQEVDRLNRLVGNLLDLTRIEAGVLRPALDWYDVREMLDTVLPRVQAALATHPLSVDLQDGIPPIQIDLLRIEELLVNLVENAAKYTPAGSPIEICVRYDNDTLCMAVVDHGPGVPELHRSRIFSHFYRGQAHSDRHPGTGLGLAICRGIAEAHRGTVTVEETPGGGATFVVRLPQPQGAQEIHA